MATHIPDPLPQAYDPDAYRALGHRVIDMLADQLARDQRREGPVLPWQEPKDALRNWPDDFTLEGGADPEPLFRRVLAGVHHLQHPRYVGHQCAAPLPLASLTAALADLVNNGTAVYEMGPVSTAMERSLVRWISGRIGFDPDRADGILTHGGSAGNLTALLAARQASAPNDVWEEGYRQAGELVLVASEQAHYSVSRAAKILGLGATGTVLIPVDEAFRMRSDALEKALDQLAQEGRRPIAVVASAGSTATGAIDPLDAIADLCEARGLWLHVDGAHSGAFAVSDTLRPRLKGIERADSVVVDAHKMLMMPSLSTFVLFREGERSFETFSQQASYLFDASARQEWFNLGHRTLECTKRPLALNLYLALKVHGTAFFAAFQERMVALAARFAELLQARPGWELAVRPEGNIVCFRFLPEGHPDPDAFQTKVRDAIVKEGSFHLVKTVLKSHVWLRTTLINPLTTEADLMALMERVEREQA